MDDTTLRLRARVTILEQLTVRLFAILNAEHAPEVKTVVANLDQTIKNAKGSKLFGADLTTENRDDLFNMTTTEWPGYVRRSWIPSVRGVGGGPSLRRTTLRQAHLGAHRGRGHCGAQRLLLGP